ncbi:DUF1801 domain-containing protein [Lutibacter sp. HS1-25]|uniref:DUF1801 domain-containing protein n=1 Tax=Lutibacter sp. HS1-25 TaxID=2485000 RepID=UPI00101295A8|nr:DUF1801 domain-containing protein [Lutibacter sp. HS1-25]RXP57613.1 DUF1801 domain-containing protein [Lutibacter sp. HS1-25]
MQIKANTPTAYIAQISEDRIPYFEKLRATILTNLPKGFEEQMSYGMIGYVVPKSKYPNGYHCNTNLPLPFVNIASQKNFIALYHLGIYADKNLYNWFVNEYSKHCKYKLDMGKSCIRFKKPAEIPFELIGELMQKISIEDWIDLYENTIKK